MEIQKGVPCIAIDRVGEKATMQERESIINYLTTGRMMTAA